MPQQYGRVLYESRFDQAKVAIQRQAAARAQMIGNEIRTSIVNGMREPKTGRIYLVPGTRRMYQASSPGQYPAIRTGALRASVRVIFLVDTTNGVFRAQIGTHLPYGMYLELGTRRMAPRPWLTRGFQDARAKVEKILAKPWKVP